MKMTLHTLEKFIQEGDADEAEILLEKISKGLEAILPPLRNTWEKNEHLFFYDFSGDAMKIGIRPDQIEED